MKADRRAYRKRARTHRLTLWLVARASRLDGSWIDRLCLRLVNRKIAPRNPEKGLHARRDRRRGNRLHCR